MAGFGRDGVEALEVVPEAIRDRVALSSVVGNSGTSLFGRMDADELATPGYAVLTPATRTKLATLDKGQLMVRHPHFTQPIFIRFPRPAVMNGREGVERYPQASDVSLAEAVLLAFLAAISFGAPLITSADPTVESAAGLTARGRRLSDGEVGTHLRPEAARGRGPQELESESWISGGAHTRADLHEGSHSSRLTGRAWIAHRPYRTSG